MKNARIAVMPLSLILAIGLLAAPSFAANQTPGNNETSKKQKLNDDAEQSGKKTEIKTGVYAKEVRKEQADYYNKREQLKLSRDEKLQIRNNLISTDNPGNFDGQHPIQ